PGFDPPLRATGRAARARSLVPAASDREWGGLMSIDVAIDSTIERTADDVFAAVADIDAWPTWLIASGIRSVRRERTGEPWVGELMVVEQTAAGRSAPF